MIHIALIPQTKNVHDRVDAEGVKGGLVTLRFKDYEGDKYATVMLFPEDARKLRLELSRAIKVAESEGSE